MGSPFSDSPVSYFRARRGGCDAAGPLGVIVIVIVIVLVIVLVLVLVLVLVK